MQIHLLPDDVINKIAAGEVIERPASVVRELVDNAIDADATGVEVELEEGGHRRIIVADDGCGMSREDAHAAFQRHATSKLTCADDLQSLATLGFRGEALASIAAIARVTLITRQAQQTTGTRVEIDGGRVVSVTDVAAAPGTRIEVTDIFCHTPARRKFLRSPRTEGLRVRSWLIHNSIVHPTIRFSITLDGERAIQLVRHQTMSERAATIFKGSTIGFSARTDRVSIEGLVGHPALAVRDSGAFVVFVNRRMVSDRMIQRAVREGFDSTLKDREFPIGFIHIELPLVEVDVNVHPQKSEVRIHDSGRLFGLIRDAVLRAVRSLKAPVGGEEMMRSTASTALPTVGSFIPTSSGFPAPLPVQNTLAASHPDMVQGGLAFAVAPQQEEPAIRLSELRYVGQILQCYLVGECGEHLYLVDMHAAHERYNFNLIRNSIDARPLPSQELLIPHTVQLSIEGVQRCLEHGEQFAQFGFQWEAFGEDTLVVRAVPALLRGGDVQAIIHELAAWCHDGGASGIVREAIDHIAARIACHASIRSGFSMSREEAYALFEALDSSPFSAACPHGRPVVVRFHRDEVECWFGRDR